MCGGEAPPLLETEDNLRCVTHNAEAKTSSEANKFVDLGVWEDASADWKSLGGHEPPDGAPRRHWPFTRRMTVPRLYWPTSWAVWVIGVLADAV